MKSSTEFQKFYKSFCAVMDLNSEKEIDVLKSIDYLKRIFYKQISEYELQERINQNIQYLFSSEPQIVYNALLSFVTVENILGKKITQPILTDYFIKQKWKMNMPRLMLKWKMELSGLRRYNYVSYI